MHKDPDFNDLLSDTSVISYLLQGNQNCNILSNVGDSCTLLGQKIEQRIRRMEKGSGRDTPGSPLIIQTSFTRSFLDYIAE